MKKKTLALLMAVIMAFGAVGATIAWLQSTSATVTNTFTFGDVTITLDEADVNDMDNDKDTSERVQTNEYKLIPGATATKDPTVWVDEDSEDCYVFVKVTATKNTTAGGKEIVTYDIGSAWKLVTGTTDVYVYGTNEAPVVVKANAKLDNILKGNSITINSALTKEEIAALDADKDGTVEDTEKPTLSFIAYAIQAENLGTNVDTAAEIWDLID